MDVTDMKSSTLPAWRHPFHWYYIIHITRMTSSVKRRAHHTTSSTHWPMRGWSITSLRTFMSWIWRHHHHGVIRSPVWRHSRHQPDVTGDQTYLRTSWVIWLENRENFASTITFMFIEKFRSLHMGNSSLILHLYWIDMSSSIINVSFSSHRTSYNWYPC